VDELREAFKVFDKDSDGSITAAVRAHLWISMHYIVGDLCPTGNRASHVTAR